MKLVLLSLVVVVGLAMAATDEEENTHQLQDIEEGRQRTVVQPDDVVDKITDVIGADPLDKLLLQIGNVLAALGILDLGGLTTDKITTIGGSLAAISTVKSALGELAEKTIEGVNFILAIIALVLLVAYLIETEGDIKGVFSGSGYARRDGPDLWDTYSGYVNTARSLWDGPVVQSLTALVHDAITKYD